MFPSHTRLFRKLLAGIKVFVFILAAAFSLFAQTPPDTSSQTKTRKVAVKTVSVRADEILKGSSDYRDSVGFDLRTFHYWDETDTLTGFTQTSGQVGKPYRQHLFGLPGTFTPNTGSGFRDFLTAEPNVYLWDLRKFLPLYDTRTPYINLDFAQSAFETQLLRIGFSQNVSPYWNTSVYYRRRSSIGPYDGFTTDHFNVVMGHHFHNYNKKLNAVLGLSYQMLNDNLNGGTLQTGKIPFEASFNGLAQPVWFNAGTTNPVLHRRVRSVLAGGSYQLRADTALWGLTLTGNISYDDFWRLYRDGRTYDSTAAAGVINQPFHPYPALIISGERLTPEGLTQNSISPFRITEGVFMNRFRGAAGARARLTLWGNTLIAKYETGVENTGLNGSGNTPGLMSDFSNLFKQFQEISGELSLIKGLIIVRNETGLAVNNVFGSEFSLKNTGILRLGKRNFELKDSTVIDTVIKRRAVRKPYIFFGTYVPFTVEFSQSFSSRNPSLFQTFYSGTTVSGFRDFNNEDINIIRAEAAYYSRPKVRRGLPYRPNFVRFGLWFSTISDYIWADTSARLRQTGQGFASAGGTVSGAVRLHRFYLDGNFSAQNLTADLPRYARSQPRFWGQAGISYENKIYKTGLTLLLSIRAHFFEGFESFTYDPATQIFFPGKTPYRIPGYARFDVMAAGRIGNRTLIFVKFIHVNENIGLPGYYTTPYYPMLGRVFSFGINWSFYD